MRITARIGFSIVAFQAALLFSSGASYVESVNGDFSNGGLTPTVLPLDPGTNAFSGSTVSGDRDYLTFHIPDGHVFQSLMLDAYSPSGGLSFIGIGSGATMTLSPTAGTAAGLLGWAHFNSGEVGTNILDDIGSGNTNGATGFTPPLPAGDYTLWIQETGGVARDYSFSLNVAPVPEPAGWALCLAGLAMGLCMRWMSATIKSPASMTTKHSAASLKKRPL